MCRSESQEMANAAIGKLVSLIVTGGWDCLPGSRAIFGFRLGSFTALQED